MPSSRKSRRDAKLGSNAGSQSFRVGAESKDVVSRKVSRKPTKGLRSATKAIIERLDECPDLDFIPFERKDSNALQPLKGNGAAALAKEVNAVLQKRRPKEKVAVYNAGATKIREIGLTRHPVRYRKRAKDGYVDVLEIDSLRRVRVRK